MKSRSQKWFLPSEVLDELRRCVRSSGTILLVDNGGFFTESLSDWNLLCVEFGADSNTFDGCGLNDSHFESVTAGRATRLVTGFDHLMRTVDLEFSTRVPPAMLSGGPDSLATRGLYLVLYMGEGEEIELPGGADSLVVTPFAVEDSEVLFCGFPLDVDTSGGPRP